MITDIIPLFAQNLICSNIDIDNGRLLELLERDIDIDESRDFYLTKSHELHTIEEYDFLTVPLLDQIKQIFDEVFEYKDIEPNFTLMWGTCCKRYQKIHSHTHPNSFMSGVYYPMMNAAPIRFHHPSPSTIVPNFRTGNLCNLRSFILNPQPSTMLLFPSALQHETATVNEDVDRYSVSFNIFLKGNIGGEPLSMLQLD